MLLQLAGSHIPHPHPCLIQNRLQNHCTHNSVAETHPQHQNIVTLPHLQMQLKGSKVTQKIKNWPHAAVKKLDNTIHWINHYPVNNAIGFPETCPVDSDLSVGSNFPPLEDYNNEIPSPPSPPPPPPGKIKLPRGVCPRTEFDDTLCHLLQTVQWPGILMHMEIFLVSLGSID